MKIKVEHCHMCNGNGSVFDRNGIEHPCFTCDGTGHLVEWDE